MKQWEDIIKDKMEEFDDTLPESVFSEFRARRDGTVHVTRRFPVIWAIVPAVAAGLAAILFLRPTSIPEEEIQIIPQPAVPMAQVDEPVEPSPIVSEQPVVSHIFTPKVTSFIEEAGKEPETQPAELLQSQQEPSDSQQETPEDRQESVVTNEAQTSPFIPDNEEKKPFNLKIAPVAGAVTGGGLIAAVVTSLVGNTANSKQADINQGLQNYANADLKGPASAIVYNPDLFTGEKHYFPIKAGMSLRVPISERLGITTGLEYSLYRSSFFYSLSGEKKQFAHYLGIPVRLDWTLVSRRWFDVYLGGGFTGDYCLGATFAGRKIRGDGFGFFVLGAAGGQVNLTERIGIYLEPELNWDVRSGKRVLKTYRSENPLMFSVATGLRINL
ncbi:MAG: hypothetical protein J6Y06_08055 [Bacteroidales bacterium]|nr:hypothetical protein [Bacteroidales bacterium]